MKYLKDENLGIAVALISFLLGSSLLVLYYLTERPELLLIGYILVGLMIIINLAVFTASTVQAIRNKLKRKRLIASSALMLINIPVAYFYFLFFIGILDASITPS